MISILKSSIFIRQFILNSLGALTILTCCTNTMELNDDPTRLFETQGLIILSFKETIPNDCQSREFIISLLTQIKLTPVIQSEHQNIEDKKRGYIVGFGNSLPPTAPWCLLTAQYIHLLAQSLGARPCLGDWGCGHGYFSMYALFVGANPWAFDFTKDVANKADQLIWASRKYLPQNLNMEDLYKVSHTSAVNPGEDFIKRQNDINVAFNLLHYLTPEDADQFFTNLFLNTKDNGVAILCVDTPFDPDFLGAETMDFYKEGISQGLKYPGFGVCSVSQVRFPAPQKDPHMIKRRAYRPTKQELDEKKFQMGYNYQGVYPILNPGDENDDGRILLLRDAASCDERLKTVLKREPTAYGFATNHALYNLFDFPELKKVMEEVGFTVINGWYTDRNLDTLFPINDAPIDLTLRGKVVIVGQKRL